VSGVSEQMTENRVHIECIFSQFFASCLLTSVLRKLTPETIVTVLFKELKGNTIYQMTFVTFCGTHQ
jgi:hypothetical protein